MESKSMTSRFVWLALIAVLATTIPHAASAQTETKTTFVFEIKDFQKLLFGYSEPAEQHASEVNPDIAILQTYLEKKGSPLAPDAEHILKHQNWKLVLAISNGESTMCKHQKYNNCWGVGGAWNLRRYNTFADGFTDVDRLLAQKYISEGKDTPSEIVRKYVGHPNANWVLAVNKVLTDLDQLGI